MSNTAVGRDPVSLTINGLAVEAAKGMTLVEAAWHAGVSRVTGVGCLEGVCGSCRVMLRRGKDVTVGLACQTFVETDIQVIFLPPASAPRHHYEIDDFKDGWDILARFHGIFPEASRCRRNGNRVFNVVFCHHNYLRFLVFGCPSHKPLLPFFSFPHYTQTPDLSSVRWG